MPANIGQWLRYFVILIFLLIMVLTRRWSFALFLLVAIFLGYKQSQEEKTSPPTPREQAPTPVSVALPEDFSHGASDGSLGFEVPHLEGAPTSAGGVFYREATEEEEAAKERAKARERALARQRQARKRREEKVSAAENASRAALHPVALTPEALVNAVVYAEILGKPKALRRFPRRR